MLGKAGQAARPRSVQFAAAELQRSTTRRVQNTEPPQTLYDWIVKGECFTLQYLPQDGSVVTGNLIRLHLHSASTCAASNLTKSGTKVISSNLLLLDQDRVVEQVVAADGSCTLLGHAACNQFRIILHGKGEIG